MIESTTRGMLDVARGVLAELDVEVVLGRVLDSARELTGARFAALGVLNESGTGLARFVTAGVEEEARRRIGSLPTGHGVLGELIRNPVPLRLEEVGEHSRSYGFPNGHPSMHSFLGVPIFICGESFGNLYLTEKHDGTPFTGDDEEALVLLADFAGLAIDHARRYTGAETRRGELQRTVDALDATVQIARTLAGQTDFDAVLKLVAKRGRALVSARALVIELQDGEDLVVAAVAGEVPRDLLGTRMSLEESVASAALRTRRIQRLEDELNRTRFAQYGLGRRGLQAAGGLVVPLVHQGQAYGVLVTVDRLDGGPHFSAEDERLLEAFAASAASAVATAQSMASERRWERLTAAEQERGRWARELHDETLQGLAGLRIALSSARRVGDPEALREAVEQAIGGLDLEIASLRSLITELRPAALDELGTESAVEALAERARRNGLSVELTVDLAFGRGQASERHSPELETATYRIVQEALTNALKHGGATRAVVEVLETDTTVEITISDDGAGFDPVCHTEGFGVLGMRERAELLHGRLEVDSTPGEGTVIRASLPIQRRRVALTAAESYLRAG
jgi:signal transduction histidine kinase